MRKKVKKPVKKEKGSLLEPQFRDEDAAREWLEAKRWPDGAVCPHCGLVGEAYRIVVKEKLSKRDGAYIESIGTYNPMTKEAEVKIDVDRAAYWISCGAQPTGTVDRLIKSNARKLAAAEAAVV